MVFLNNAANATRLLFVTLLFATASAFIVFGGVSWLIDKGKPSARKMHVAA